MYIKLGQLFKSNIVILGGVGFAKYEPYYNCQHIIGPRKMTRRDETRESEELMSVYNEAMEDPMASNALVIVVSHYPLKAWMPEYKDIMSKRCIYFSGHTHRNTTYLKNGYHVYSNNQVGYNKEVTIKLKKAMSGTIVNPFAHCGDGVYKISPDRYLQFLHFCGENLNGVSKISHKLNRGLSKLYMIKRLGFYGFFIIGKGNNAFICYGANYKKIDVYEDIVYFNKRFIAVVNMYMMALLPYRNAIMEIAEAVKKLGLDGGIHGAIIDLDFYNHIMVNPDGTLTIYNSPLFGFAEKYESFERYLVESGNKKALEKYRYGKKNQLSVLNFRDGDTCRDMVRVDTSSNSMYGFSRKMRNIERLFTCNVLREWEETIVRNIIE